MSIFHLPLPNSRVTYKRVTGTNPAANVELGDAVPANKIWILLSYFVALVQGITQTPQPILQFDDGVNVFWESIGSTAAQAASTTCAYTWAHCYTAPTAQFSAGATVRSFAPLSQIPLLAGYHIKSSTLGLGANSDYGAPLLYVAEIDLS